MKTAGVVVDFYDDLSGALLKKACPTSDELPEVVKTAHILSPEERDALRDEAFALVMHNDGKTLRKFACVDEGNTVLSVLYFMENFSKLPEEAVKTAAANLLEYCEEYGIEAPYTVKLAATSGMSRKRDPGRQPGLSDDAEWAQRTNIVSIQGGGSDSGRVIPTASQMKTAEARQGGLVLTDDKKHEGVKKKMPKIQVNKNPDQEPIDFLHDFHKLNPEAKPKHASVDVSGQEPDVEFKKTASSRTALGGRYPLDSMADVQKALEYFDENYKTMEPIEAHIFGVKTASRAEELGLPVSEALQRYGSTEYADDVDAHMANRLTNTLPEYKEIYTELREKRASIEPEEFAELLRDADTVSGLRWAWHGTISDPYYATFGKTASAWSWQSRTGDFVSEDELVWLARNGRPLMHKHFSSEMVNGFIKEPIPVFDSLPDDTKTIIARLANGKFDGAPTN